MEGHLSSSPETPEGLVSAIGKGNSHAETVLLEKYYRKVLFILRKRTGNEEQARDLCQEAFRVVLERLRREPLDEPGKLPSYLLNTAINLHIGEIRKSERRKTHADSDYLDAVADEESSHFDMLARERARRAVRGLLEELDNERDRRILYLYYIDEMDKEEVCTELDLSHRHFDKVISRARKRFKDLLDSGRSGRLREELA